MFLQREEETLAEGQEGRMERTEQMNLTVTQHLDPVIQMTEEALCDPSQSAPLRHRSRPRFLFVLF